MANSVVSASDLAALETLLNEFYASQTSNTRKREIEQVLTHFGNQNNAWQQCLGFLATNQNNHFVSMFVLTTLESIVRRRWIGMLGNEKAEIRSQLHEYLMKRHESIPSYVRNKTIKIVVDIAASDWPHFYPDFFDQVLDLLRRKETLILGLSMLLITSEELATPRDNVSSQRKEELKRLLNSQVPIILSTMSWVLESLMSYFRGRENDQQQRSTSQTSSTPPPSPSPSLAGTNDESSSDSSDRSTFTQSLLHVATNKLALQMSPPEANIVEASSLALRCLTHLFTWIPLTTVISARLLASIFHFVTLGFHCNKSESRNSDVGNTYNELGILAMATINEIIYRHCVPLDFEDFLLQMFQNTFELLQLLVTPKDGNEGSPPRLHLLDESFVEKFTEFLSSFVKSHLRRFESNTQFPILVFLNILFKYTFEQQSLDRYLSCLDVWNICIDYVQGLISSRVPEADQILPKYRGFLLLANEVLKQLQFRCHSAQLEELDDQEFDDDEETEWQHYLRSSIECIMRVADVFPDDVLQLMDTTWKDTMAVFMQVENYIKGDQLILSNEEECKHLHYVLRDFASLLQIIGRLSHLFIGEVFQDRIHAGNEFMKHLVGIVSFSSNKKLYAISTPVPHLNEDFVEVHAQALAALKAWCHWLSQLHSLALKDSTYEPQCKDLTSRIMFAVSPVLKEQPVTSTASRQKLVHSASHFLCTLTGTVRPPSIWKLKEFTELYSSLNHLKLEADDHRLMVKALTNVLLLPWPGIMDQRWDERQRHLAKFLRDLTETFRGIRMMGDLNSDIQEQVKPVIIHTLRIIRDMADNVLNEVTHSKKLCYECSKEYIDIALWLFPAYIHDTSMCEELFAFFHTVLDVLKSQMGAESIEATIGTFINVFNKDQLTQIILNEGSAGIRVVEKFLGILQFVVKESDLSFRKFIDSTLSLCLDYIYPLVADRPTADIKAPLFTVLGNVLLYNWRHFFKSSVMRSLIGAPSPIRNQSDQVQHKVQFLAILNALGQSFLQPDIVVFKQNLITLEKLNEKWKLYHKPIFTESLIGHFLTVFLQVLMHKSHDLLKEEITLTIFHMANVDLNAFFKQFLMDFLNKIEDLDSNQKEKLQMGFKNEVDLPSFTTNLHRFIGDLRYYKICNASLPAGSVSFNM